MDSFFPQLTFLTLTQWIMNTALLKSNTTKTATTEHTPSVMKTGAVQIDYIHSCLKLKSQPKQADKYNIVIVI